MKLIPFGNLFVPENEVNNVLHHIDLTIDYYQEIIDGIDDDGSLTGVMKKNLEAFIVFLYDLKDLPEKGNF